MPPIVTFDARAGSVRNTRWWSARRKCLRQESADSFSRRNREEGKEAPPEHRVTHVRNFLARPAPILIATQPATHSSACCERYSCSRNIDGCLIVGDCRCTSTLDPEHILVIFNLRPVDMITKLFQLSEKSRWYQTLNPYLLLEARRHRDIYDVNVIVL